MSASSENRAQAKLRYSAPVLTEYGSVRDLTGNNVAGSFADAGAMLMVGSSEPSLKEDVVRVGEHPAGFGLYLFSYKAEYRDECGHGRQFGVMADEVEAIVPEAVMVGENGYRLVDYARLGITRH